MGFAYECEHHSPAPAIAGPLPSAVPLFLCSLPRDEAASATRTEAPVSWGEPYSASTPQHSPSLASGGTLTSHPLFCFAKPRYWGSPTSSSAPSQTPLLALELLRWLAEALGESSGVGVSGFAQGGLWHRPSSSKQNSRSEMVSKFLTLRVVPSWDSSPQGVLKAVVGDVLTKFSPL